MLRNLTPSRFATASPTAGPNSQDALHLGKPGPAEAALHHVRNLRYRPRGAFAQRGTAQLLGGHVTVVRQRDNGHSGGAPPEWDGRDRGGATPGTHPASRTDDLPGP